MQSTILSITRLCGLLILCSLISISCSKEKSNAAEEAEVSRISSEADIEAEIIFNSIFDDVMGVSDEVGMGGIGIFGREGSGRLTACMNVTISHPSGNVFPAIVEIDFGSTPCQGIDGNTRQGKIIIEYTKRLIVPGAIATAIFQDFYINDIQVEGTYRVTNQSSPVNTTPLSRQFKTEVINGKLSKPLTKYIEWNSTRIIAQTEGLITPDFPRDDVYQITGSSSGKTQRENLLVVWESSVLEPLIKRIQCRWLVKGSIKTTRTGSVSGNSRSAVIDFGSGTCDNKAVITINGIQYEITLR